MTRDKGLEDALQRIERDLVSAYGELPRSAQTFVMLAEIRAAASSMSVRAIRRQDQDIIFETARPRELEQRMAGARGTLRMVTHGSQGQGETTELYYRPPKNYLESDTLLTVLRRRLTSADERPPEAGESSRVR